ncbi:sensor histidine kinase [Micromonospora echinofusca]|uniref:Sensor histidine kinase n=1 Tax=Micromonospora echinofusca TaxID=47858 RepID=A0ABS3VMS7_MICEH|nr:sensor histidine kinase [Micromonospora echinofusca]MBO4205830.1 sensor histidine kinase [Micromonospora echinofusca]
MDRAPHPVAPSHWRWIWDLYFAVCLVVVLVLVVEEQAVSLPARLAAAVLLSLMALWYTAYGRAAVRGADGSRESWIFVGVAALLFLAAVAFVPTSTFALPVICPMVFLALPLTRAALVVILLNVLPPAITAIHAGTLARVHDLLPIAVLGVIFALLVGAYIDRIAGQNDERAQIIAELQARRAEVARLSHEAGVAEERARLAAEIHDTLAQGFTSIITLIQAAESEADTDRDAAYRHLGMAVRTARENLAEARAMVTALTPTSLRTETLADAIGRQVDRLAEETGIGAEYEVDGVTGELPTAVEVVLLRTVQETLANVRKHAHASDVAVRLSFTDTSVTLTVTDDGIGFDSTTGSHGFGLRGMRARAEQIGATLEISSVPGEGTTVRLEASR